MTLYRFAKRGLLPAACVFFLLAAGCTTRNTTNPARSATEEMLISTATDRAAAQLAVTLPPHTKVFVDSTNFAGTDAKDMDSKYAITAIHAAMLKQGHQLVDDKKDASVIVEARVGALSTDTADLLIGIPSFDLPVPLASGALPFPKLALYEDSEQTGVAKLGLTSRDAKSGDLITAQDPQHGFAFNATKTAFFFFSWTENDAYPANYRNGFLRDKDKLSNALSSDQADKPEQAKASSQLGAVSTPQQPVTTK